jgi:hypothetical protein
MEAIKSILDEVGACWRDAVKLTILPTDILRQLDTIVAALLIFMAICPF